MPIYCLPPVVLKLIKTSCYTPIFILIGDVLSGDTLCHAGCLPIVYHYLGIKITDRRCTAVLTAEYLEN
ncbi:hypothetical protein [Ruminococcus bicirculans (ex Wegman et al. 2014)]|uniref:hypothetical protein n=1 Tax=Ruminococcus bicirculans (ex Wegman et al. 2014) TaxID=1160721 RepID=UPI0024322913|nr:hypothetical protein [Ruminococcus bicirculans (ex Wegman et al. 2014)]